MARFSSSSLLSVLSISFSWFSSVPLVIIIISSRNAFLAFNERFERLLVSQWVHKNGSGVCMLMSRFQLLCWSYEVFVCHYVKDSGYRHILNLFCWSIGCLLMFLVVKFELLFCPLIGLCSAFLGLVLRIASFNFFESRATFVIWSAFTVMTTGLKKCSSENCVSFYPFGYSFLRIWST